LSKGQAIHHAIQIASRFDIPSFHLDTSYDPVPITPTEINTGEQNVILRGTIYENRIKELEDLPDVIKVYKDVQVEHFSCPIPPCDCTPGIAKGTIAEVAHYLGVDKIWSCGQKGHGIIIGLVDGGITALGL
jgi:serine protease AprX